MVMKATKAMGVKETTKPMKAMKTMGVKDKTKPWKSAKAMKSAIAAVKPTKAAAATSQKAMQAKSQKAKSPKVGPKPQDPQQQPQPQPDPMVHCVICDEIDFYVRSSKLPEFEAFCNKYEFQITHFDASGPGARLISFNS